MGPTLEKEIEGVDPTQHLNLLWKKAEKRCPCSRKKPKALVCADSVRQVKLEHRGLAFSNPREPFAVVP